MSSSSATIRGLRKEVKTLRNESEKQKLAIEALTRFLVEEKIVDQRKLEDFIVDVDAEDGIVDGKLAIDPTNGRLQLNANPPQKETEFKGHRIRILR
ncbi:MAG: hypothetical protein P1U89_10725 [Verrucomicrobiales bacterium]|nr:hypothetical protein [Verrucomicrobiales bacterium]